MKHIALFRQKSVLSVGRRRIPCSRSASAAPTSLGCRRRDPHHLHGRCPARCRRHAIRLRKLVRYRRRHPHRDCPCQRDHLYRHLHDTVLPHHLRRERAASSHPPAAGTTPAPPPPSARPPTPTTNSAPSPATSPAPPRRRTSPCPPRAASRPALSPCRPSPPFLPA